jgi:tripartite-type tricarboxylate transporter receptor subunit TctC
MRGFLNQRLSALFALVLAGVSSLLAGSAVAQTEVYPSRPVRVIVPYAAGGSSDQVARPFSDRLTQALGQQFVVDNKGGAAGAIGGEAAARSPKDGYTLLLAPTSTLLIVPNFRPTPYGLQDFVAVARIADAYSVMGVHPSLPVNSVKELVEYGRKNPGKINYGTAGVGSIQHLRMEAINRSAGIGMVHVPYRGSGEALTDLVAGQIQLMTEILLLPQIRAGKLRPLAMFDIERNADFPDVPTMKEAAAGLPFENLSMPSWFALFAPAGTPDGIVRKLNAAVVGISRDKEFGAQLYKFGYRLGYDTPEELAASMQRENAMYAGLIRDVGLRQEN